MEGVAGQGPARVAAAHSRRPFAVPQVSDRGHGECTAPARAGVVAGIPEAAMCQG